MLPVHDARSASLTDDAITSLDEILGHLTSAPWHGLNHDFCVVPALHPVAQHAVRVTPQASVRGNRFHIFTDGSWKGDKGAWAFVLLCDCAPHLQRTLCRIGFAGAVLDDELSPFEPCAADAEATAIIAAADYMLSLVSSHPSLEIHLHFDCTSVGYGALGLQRVPQHHGHISMRQRGARAMLALLQRVSNVIGLHVHAHEMNPFNECADSIASCIRQGWFPQHPAKLRCRALLCHPLRDWAWIQVRPSEDLPDLRTILNASNVLPEQPWSDATFCLPATTGPTCAAVSSPFVFATVNVGTLGQGTQTGTSEGYKVQELDRQFFEAGFDVVALQETRARHSETKLAPHYFRIIAAGLAGHHGVELWFAKQSAAFNFAGPFDVHQHCAVWHSTPRLLAVHVEVGAFSLDVLSLYAPQRGVETQEIETWWAELTAVLSRHRSSTPLVLLGDCNARVGSVVTPFIGDLSPDIEDVAGACFRELCERFKLLVPSTWSLFHEGDSATYRSHFGAQSRIDYIAVSECIQTGIVSSFVDPTIDVLNGDHDHSVLVLKCHLAAQQSKPSGFCRRVAYDRTAAAENVATGTVDPLAALPSQPWLRDANVHWSHFRDHLQAVAIRAFPKQKRQQRQPYFDRIAWQLVCDSKDLRRLVRTHEHSIRAAILKKCFAAWCHYWWDDEVECVDVAAVNAVMPALQLHVHSARLQLALTLWQRIQIIKRFRQHKRDAWIQWASVQIDTRLAAVEHAPASRLFAELKPKPILAKAQGKHRRPQPGMLDHEGHLCVGPRQIALAWQAQFSDIKHAIDTTMPDLLDLSVPQPVSLDPLDLTKLPTLFDLENALRGLALSKAPGLDGLGPELFRVSIPNSARALYPILLKAAVRQHWLPELSGGWLIPLHKGKISKRDMAGYRGILLEAVAARLFSRAWRPRLVAGITDIAAPQQWGGRAGLSPTALHLQLHMWKLNAQVAKESLGVIFINIKSAFYSIAKPLLDSFGATEEGLHAIFQRLRLPPTARDAFVAHALDSNLVREATGSPLLASFVRAALSHTWFVVPGGDSVKAPTCGSRPGDPCADVLFGFVMSAVLHEVNTRLGDLGSMAHSVVDKHCMPRNITWVDDIAIAVYGPPHEVCDKVLHTLSIVLDVFTELLLRNVVGLSIVSLHAGAWGALTIGEYKAWQAALVHLYRLLHPPSRDSASQHRSIYELAYHARAPLPMEALHFHRLRLFIHLVQVHDFYMLEAIMVNWHLAGDQSWLASLRKSVVWWAEQIGYESLPSPVFQLQDVASWKELLPVVRELKKALRAAQRCHQLRIQNLLTVEEHATKQAQILQDMGWTPPPPVEEHPPLQHQCAECGIAFATPAALAVHETHKHGVRLAMRRFGFDGACRICRRFYHTRPRLLHHLHYGSTDCWVAMLRRYVPLSVEDAAALDEKDRAARLALHQRNVKPQDLDQAWRPATEEELEGGLPLLPCPTWDLDAPPTPTELDAWKLLGSLPPGRGGRVRTNRLLADVTLPHAEQRLTQLEVAWHSTCDQWTPNFDWIPRPLAQGQLYVLLLYSGHRRVGDIASWVWWQSDYIPICVDLSVDQTYGNVFDSSLWLSLIHARKVIAAHAAPPCETFTFARWIPPPDNKVFPRPLRDTWSPWGRGARTPREVMQLCVGNTLMVRGLFLVLMVYLYGGAFTVEHPADQPDRHDDHHASLWGIWNSAFVRQLLLAADIRTVTFLQGPLRRPYPKPTTILSGRLPGLAMAIFTQYDLRWRASERLGGRGSDGAWRTAVAKVYPERMCYAIGSQFVQYGLQCVQDGFEPDPSALPAALAVLSWGWDPYLEQSHSMGGDFNIAAVPNSHLV
eukprot:Skav203467  [mRNA]  locus=scaffold3193:38496:44295:+ [translate_table: standard]